MSAVDTLVNQGWLIEKYSAAGIEYLKKLRVSFLDAVKNISPNCERLQDVHLYLSEDKFEDLHYNLTVLLHKTQPFYTIFKGELITLKKVFGLDLDIQSYPSLRISRPNIKDDNLQIHRDIEYGASIYEHSLWTPLHDVKIGGGMKLLPESIYSGYDGYELIDQTSKFKKGSKKNKSGLLYSFKSVNLSSKQSEKLIEPKINFGEFLIIPQIVVHGSIMNTSNETRWSVDTRICSPLAQDERSTLERRRTEIRGLVEDGQGLFTFYRPLCRSATLRLIDKFLNIQHTDPQQ